MILFFIIVTINISPKLNAVFKSYELNEPIRSGNNKDYIAFTCNVDWGNEEIPLMLEILEKNNLRITFFVTGRWAKNNPELLKEIYNKGHEIGNHGYGHRMHSKLS